MHGSTSTVGVACVDGRLCRVDDEEVQEQKEQLKRIEELKQQLPANNAGSTSICDYVTQSGGDPLEKLNDLNLGHNLVSLTPSSSCAPVVPVYLHNGHLFLVLKFLAGHFALAAMVWAVYWKCRTGYAGFLKGRALLFSGRGTPQAFSGLPLRSILGLRTGIRKWLPQCFCVRQCSSSVAPLARQSGSR